MPIKSGGFTDSCSEPKIVGYYYGKGRPGCQLSQVPVQELTNLIYSHAKPTGRGDCEMAHADVDIPNLLALKALTKGSKSAPFDIALIWGMEWLNLFFRYRLVTEII
jgi:hypothetical protein